MYCNDTYVIHTQNFKMVFINFERENARAVCCLFVPITSQLLLN
jgi:hypothetical protein